MILYNVTVSVEPAIASAWVAWMKSHHIPEVMATGMFERFHFFRVLLQKDETETYSVQYFASSMAKLQQYQAQFAQRLQASHQAKFGDRVMAFRTVLEEV